MIKSRLLMIVVLLFSFSAMQAQINMVECPTVVVASGANSLYVATDAGHIVESDDNGAIENVPWRSKQPQSFLASYLKRKTPRFRLSTHN